MNETNKTLTFVVAALVTLGAAWFSRPKPIGVDVPDQVGQVLFPDFKDPYDAKNMKIVEYDEELGELSEFEVAQKNGLWVIPSHHDYPADAEESLAAAANLLVDLKVINVVSNQVSDHATYGVSRPSREKVQAGDKGVGKLVSFRDGKGIRLAEVVIGKPVPGQPDQRFVRSGEQERVYIVKLDPNKLTTKFENWVKRDILELNAFDIQDVTIYDYSTNPQLTNQGLAVSQEDRLRMGVNWDADNATWELDSLEEFIDGDMRRSELSENEQLDIEALNKMKQALDELQIVDVERKPPGLGKGLKVEENFWDDQDGLASLVQRGFYPARTADGDSKLLSGAGEMTVNTTDGVEYVLRFGSIAGVEKGSGQEAAQGVSEEQGEEIDSTKSTGLNRFVMVTASVNEAAFEKPVLDLPDDGQEVTDASTDEAADETTEANAEQPEDSKPEDAEAENNETKEEFV